MVVAAVVAGALSGAPSNLHALLTGRSPLEAARAAGNVALPTGAPPRRLLGAGALVHVLLSLLWATVITRLLPHRRPVAFGALAGVAIATLDFGLVGRHRPRVAALPAAPQVADHIAFGALAATVLRRLRRG